MDHYTGKGGIRYGDSFWRAMNFTWPFVTLTASVDRLSIRVSIGRFVFRSFDLERSQVNAIKKKRGLLSVGIEIEHSNADLPPFLLFGTFCYDELERQLESLGYPVAV